MTTERQSKITALLFVLAAAPIAAQTPSLDSDNSHWTPELLLRYRAIMEVALSRNGERIAYVVREPVMDGERSEFVSHIWLATSEGRNNVRFTRGDKSSMSPAFSPDGEWLGFLSARSGSNQVWIIPVRGGEAWQATQAEMGVSSFAWSPDGRTLAYVAMDPKTDDQKTAEQEKRDVIVLDRVFQYGHIHVVPFDGAAQEPQEARRLTEGSFHVAGFDWSPDGRRIVFEHRPDATEGSRTLYGDLWLVDVESGVVQPLVTSDGVESLPRFSPDGRWVAFASSGEGAEPIGLADVYVVAANGGEPRKLAELPDREMFFNAIVGWKPDASSVYVSQVVRTEHHLFALPVNGGAPRRVTTDAGAYFHFALSRDGSRIAFTYETNEVPHDVYSSAADDFAMHRVSDLHRDVPRPPLGRTDVLRWRSTDGREIEGLLMYPIGHRPGQRVPLVVEVHGGPSGAFLNTFAGGYFGLSLYSLPWFTQRGFAILRPNPRGSTGYGKEFRYAVVKEWGYSDLEDILSGVDHAIELGVAHPDSLVLMGWSYGGYMAAFAVTRTDRFKAASMGAGISNLISMMTTHDIPDYMAAHMGGQEYWDDYATYERHSAVYRIGNVKTPTQVIHGENDDRVPKTQGLEFYNALRRRGVPTEMILYPRTGHGVDEPKLLIDLNHRVMDWFERHLGRRPLTSALSLQPAASNETTQR